MSLISKSHLRFILKNIKALLSKKADKSDIVQSNWEQNDESALDYVKNRTHWEEKVSKPYVIAQDLKLRAIDDGYYAEIKNSRGFTAGETVTVTYSECVEDYEDITVTGVAYKTSPSSYEVSFEYLADNSLKVQSVTRSDGTTDVVVTSWFYTKATIILPDVIAEEETVIHHLDPKYIKDMYYETEPVETILVDNLTLAQYEEGESVPKCNFIPGQFYNVIWNGELYENLECQLSDGWNVIGNPDELPFYIDDDGGDNLYIEVNDDSDWTISILTMLSQIHHVPTKYIKDMYYDNGTTITELVPSQTVSGFALTLDPCYGVQNPFELLLVKDNTYIINWDGTDYELKCEIVNGMPAVGNSEFLNDNFDGIPFLITNGGFIIILTTSTAESHTISITEIYHDLKQIDMKYIPDNIKYNIEDLGNNIYNKMNKDNPVGTGSFSMNRKANTTVGEKSCAIGNNCTASGKYSCAIGDRSKATAWGAFAAGGEGSTASGTDSFVEGCANTASGDRSHAEGNGTIASGSNSHAQGYRTIASGSNSHAQGKCNIEDTENKYAHIVGNGDSDTARSNAHTLDWNGNAWYQGDVYVKSTSGTNRDEGSKKLATEEYVDNAEKLTINMTRYNLPRKYGWEKITYGDNKFVAITGVDIVYSMDGITWTKTTGFSHLADGMGLIIYNGDKFVIICSASKYAAYSTDGITWTQVILPASSFWRSIAYGDGKFVVVHDNPSRSGTAYSTDGITWTTATFPWGTGGIGSIVYGDGKFVCAPSDYSTTIGVYSTDGITWTKTTMPSMDYSKDNIAYGDGKFVVVAKTEAAYSTDGITWTKTMLPPLDKGSWNGIAFGNGKFITISELNSYAAYSTDGITWTKTMLPSDGVWCSITYGDGKFVAINDSNGTTAISTDGIIWKSRHADFQQNNEDVTEVIKEVVLEDINKKIDNLHASQSHFTLIDDTTSYEYIIRMQNGNLTSICKASSLAVSTLPTKTTYTVGEALDLTDMVVTLTRQDGATEEVNNYGYTEPDMSVAGTVNVTVSYVEAGETYSATFAVTITEATTTEETETTT